MPVGDLAPELLYQIFDMAIHRDNEQVYTSQYDSESPRTVMALSHTCSYWRHVCIACPELWTFLPVDHMSKKLLRLFVKRSAPKLLSLFSEHKKRTSMAVILESTDTMLKYFIVRLSHRRCNDLASRVERMHARRELNPHLLRESPRLEELIVEHGSLRGAHMKFPKLRKLELSGYATGPTFVPVLPACLVELRLVGSPIEFKRLLHLLSTVPDLKIFYLGVERLTSHFSTSEFNGAISLPAMRHITLELHNNEYSSLLGRGVPPESEWLSVEDHPAVVVQHGDAKSRHELVLVSSSVDSRGTDDGVCSLPPKPNLRFGDSQLPCEYRRQIATSLFDPYRSWSLRKLDSG